MWWSVFKRSLKTFIRYYTDFLRSAYYSVLVNTNASPTWEAHRESILGLPNSSLRSQAVPFSCSRILPAQATRPLDPILFQGRADSQLFAAFFPDWWAWNRVGCLKSSGDWWRWLRFHFWNTSLLVCPVPGNIALRSEGNSECFRCCLKWQCRCMCSRPCYKCRYDFALFA